MSSTASPHWREKAAGFFSASGIKLKQAGQSAAEVAKDTSSNFADAAGRMGSLVKSRWALLQQTSLQQPKLSKEAVQERILTAAASTGTLLKKGISETKDKVSVGKMKVEEAAKRTADRSKNILSNIERWQKGPANDNVFGVPIEVVIQRQQSDEPIPQVLVRCANYLVLSGLNTEFLFKSEGDKKIVQQLISLYNQEWNAVLPVHVNPIDVAALMKFYLASLPEPLTTFALYSEIRDARSSINDMRNILQKLPSVNYMTLEYITALLLRVSQKSSLNKMTAHNLSVELAPMIIWQKGDHRAVFRYHHNYMSQESSKDIDSHFPRDILSDEEDDGMHASSHIPLDDGSPPDYGAIEVIQCLIEHHNAIFTDANETTW